MEIDEMYAGAPPRKRAKPSRDHDDSEPPANPKGRGTKRPLVLVAAERGGDVVAKVIPTHGKAAIAEALDGVVDPQATLMTDGLPAYSAFDASVRARLMRVDMISRACLTLMIVVVIGAIAFTLLG